MEEGKNGELNPNSFPLADSELLLKDADVEVSTMANPPRALWAQPCPAASHWLLWPHSREEDECRAATEFGVEEKSL